MGGCTARVKVSGVDPSKRSLPCTGRARWERSFTSYDVILSNDAGRPAAEASVISTRTAMFRPSPGVAEYLSGTPLH